MVIETKDAVESSSVSHALAHALAVNLYGYEQQNGAKRILRDYFPDMIVKRGNPPTYGKDLICK